LGGRSPALALGGRSPNLGGLFYGWSPGLALGDSFGDGSFGDGALALESRGLASWSVLAMLSPDGGC